MTGIQLTEKFIAYVDILGYSALTKAAEAGRGLTFEELQEIQKMLGIEDDRTHHQKYGPTICPHAPRIRHDLDFHIAQVWDSVVVSTELSPAGVIALASHCFEACINLLTKGVMCRGYIRKGMIYHNGQKIFGSGHVDTVAKERDVSFLKRDADERGTPFIEVDPEVVDYVAKQPDECVKTMFDRMVFSHEGLTAIFPIKRLRHSFIISGYRAPRFDPAKEKKSNNNLRQNIIGLRDKLLSFVDQSDPNVMRKVHHYLRALDEQLKVCDRTDRFIDMLTQPIHTR
jgi:hypothetical protein